MDFIITNLTFIYSNIDITLLHLALAVILFLIVNWLGEHSLKLGYIYETITMFLKKEEEAIAFNYFFNC